MRGNSWGRLGRGRTVPLFKHLYFKPPFQHDASHQIPKSGVLALGPSSCNSSRTSCGTSSLGTSRAAATPSARAKYAGGGRCFPVLGVLGQPLKSMTCQWPSFGKSIICRSCLWGNRVFSIMCCTALSACIDQDYWQDIKLRHNSPFFLSLPRHPHFPSSTWNMVDLVNATQERGHRSRIYKDSSTRQGSGFSSENMPSLVRHHHFKMIEMIPKKTFTKKRWNSSATSLMNAFCKAGYAT